MNYYERHLGDYAKDAGHLSMLEHGAYTLLLDRYYATEQPIPVDQAYKVCRARSCEERAAVDAVLREFFQMIDGAWVNRRADQEVRKMQAKVKAARENGKRGGRPKRTEPEPNENPPGFDWVTQTKALQTPDTRHQHSDAYASGSAAAPPPAVDVIFALGVPLLTAAGVSERSARSMLGLLRKQHPDEAVVAALQRCAVERPVQPVPWLQAALRTPTAPPAPAAKSFRERDAEAARAIADAWMGSAKPERQDHNIIELDEVTHARLAPR